MARIPYPEQDGLEPATASALSGMKPMNVFRMLARADSMAPSIFETATQLFTPGRTELPPRLRQIAILRVAGATGSAYLLAHHEPISRRIGLTEAEIGAAKAGAGALGSLETAVAQFATESSVEIKVGDKTFAPLRSALSDRQLAELSIVVGFYNFLARFLAALQVEIEPPRPAKTNS
jgi:alkylhydroperoxidase family enzyme